MVPDQQQSLLSPVLDGHHPELQVGGKAVKGWGDAGTLRRIPGDQKYNKWCPSSAMEAAVALFVLLCHQAVPQGI